MPKSSALIAAAAPFVLSVGCSDPPAPAEEEPAAWRVVLDGGDLDRAVLSVWGTGPNDVFAVGGPLGNAGLQSLALHYDGAAWRELAPGGEETLWWVAGSGPEDVWMVGEQGRAVHWDGASFTEHETGTTATLWGAVVLSPGEAWAVGGMPGTDPESPKDVVLRWDGTSWSPEPLPQPPGRALFKVWGKASDDLYAVGEGGVIWHRAGTTWQREAPTPPVQASLLTTWGCSSDEIYAVGSRNVLRSDGETWTALEVDLNSDVNGVSCARPGEVAIVGSGGLKQRLVGGAWINEFTEEPYTDLHAVWADSEGAFWAVGGDFFSAPTAGRRRDGVVARHGKGKISDVLRR
jgi:hypothetical protein